MTRIMREWLVMGAVTLLLILGVVAWVWHSEIVKERAQQQEEIEARAREKACEVARGELDKAVHEARAAQMRDLRKLELRGKMTGGGQLSPDEAVELRMLREMEAKERIDEIK